MIYSNQTIKLPVFTIYRLDEGHSCVGPSKRYYSCNVQVTTT